MSEKARIEFLGYSPSNDAVIKHKDGAIVGWSKMQLELYLSCLDHPRDIDVVKHIFAEWPDSVFFQTKREQRLEQALREIRAEAVPDMTWLASEAIIKRIGEIADEALHEGTGE